MRIATLNLRHGGGRRVPSLLQYISGLGADVLVLTEFRVGRTGSELREGLSVLGYNHQVASTDVPAANAVLLTSRLALRDVERSVGPVGHEHRFILAAVRPLQLIGVYFPQGEEKRPVFNQLINMVPKLSPLGLIIGDFNTGQHRIDEAGSTFSCADSLLALQNTGLVDCWRTRNPSKSEYSWYSSKGNGFRVDHVLATAEVDRRISSAEYQHQVRTSGVSDHSALLVEYDEVLRPYEPNWSRSISAT